MKKPESQEKPHQDTPSPPRRQKTTSSTPQHTTARIPSKQKLTRMKQLAAKGRSHREIAIITGFSHPMIDKYIQRIEDSTEPLKRAQSHMADILQDNFTYASGNLSRMLIEQAERDVSALSPTELNRSTETMSKVVTFMYNQWRLASGKSTSNNSHSVQVNQVHQALDFSQPSSGSGSSGEELHQSLTS